MKSAFKEDGYIFGSSHTYKMPGNIRKPSVIIIGPDSHPYIFLSPLLIFSGAGTGGIATSARLAQLGFQVTVVEKHKYIGGRCSLIAKDGYVSISERGILESQIN